MEPFEATDFIQKVQDHKKQIITVSAALLGGAIVLITYFQSGPNALHFANAERAFVKWEAAPTDDALYFELRKAIHAAPSLRKKYEAAIAQRLLNIEKVDEALELAMNSLNRVKEATPFHSAYAETTLLIEQGAYQEALENAVSLKEKMGSDMPLLYAHNLLRIACLHQKLNNQAGEKAAWEELEAFLGKSAISDVVKTNFTEQSVDLEQYISERKKHL